MRTEAEIRAEVEAELAALLPGWEDPPLRAPRWRRLASWAARVGRGVWRGVWRGLCAAGGFLADGRNWFGLPTPRGPRHAPLRPLPRCQVCDLPDHRVRDGRCPTCWEYSPFTPPPPKPTPPPAPPAKRGPPR